MDQGWLQAGTLILLAYLSGSIPTGAIVTRLASGPDLRTIGSGRMGGTNALRALGRGWALVVVIGDVLKGAIPVIVARIVTGDDASVVVLAAIAAIIGATHSIFIGFHGGRGVATGIGTMAAINLLALVIAAPIFLGAVLLTRYVSLGSILGAAAIFPATVIAFWITDGGIPIQYLLFAIVGPALIWISHRDNIGRLVRGEERRLDFELLRGKRPRA